MERKRIQFRAVDEVLQLVRIAEEQDAGLYLVDDEHRIAAKSLLGVFSVGLGKPITIEILGDDQSRADAVEALKPFTVG